MVKVKVNANLKFSLCGGIDMYLHSFLTWALDVGERFPSGCCRFNPSKVPQYALGGPQIRSKRFGECISIFSWLQIPNVPS